MSIILAEVILGKSASGSELKNTRDEFAIISCDRMTFLFFMRDLLVHSQASWSIHRLELETNQKFLREDYRMLDR